MTLYHAEHNSDLKLRLTPDDRKVRQFFSQLGLRTGDWVRILRKAPFGGPLVVKTRAGQVAIGRRLAERVRVEVMP